MADSPLSSAIHPATFSVDEQSAGMRILQAWRAYRLRESLATLAQARTPYVNEGHYRMATNSYAPALLKERPIGSALSQAEVRVYLSAGSIPSGKRALLHSFRRKVDLSTQMKRLNVSSACQIGIVYDPSGCENHDMRVNTAWMLGLAHFNRQIVMTTRLDDETIVRGSAATGAPEQWNVEHNLSAYAREVLGLLQSGYFMAQRPMEGTQILSPTPGARKATLEGLKTPRGMPKAELRHIFEQKGIDVSRITPEPLSSEPAEAAMRARIDDLKRELESIESDRTEYKETWRIYRDAIKVRPEDPLSVPDNVLPSLVKANGELMHRAQSLHATFSHGDLDHLPEVADELQSATHTLIDAIAAQADAIDRLVRKRYPKSRFWNASCFWDKRLRWISVEIDALWERTASLEKALAPLGNNIPVPYSHYYQHVLKATKRCHQLDDVFNEEGVAPKIGESHIELINEWNALYEKLDELGDTCLEGEKRRSEQ